MKDAPKGKSIFFSFSNAVWFAFLLYVFSLALMQPFINYKNLRFSVSDFIFPVLFGLFVIAVFSRKIVFRFHKIYFFLLAYFLAMFVSAVFSINPKQSFIKLAGEFYLLSLTVITINLVSNNIEKLKTVVKIWLAGLILTIFVGLLTIFLFYFQRDFWLLDYTTSIYGAVPVGNYPRLTSTFGSASMFCNYLNISFFLLIIAEYLQILSRRIFVILLILLTICAVFTISSSIGGIILGFAVWIGFLFREKNKLISKCTYFGGIIFAILFFFSNFIALQKHPTAPFTLPIFGFELYPSSRFLVWIDSAQTFFDNFLTGKGLGQNACQVIFQNTEGTPAFLTDAHNIFLSVAAQNGILGLIAFTALFFHILGLQSASETGKNRVSVILYFMKAAIFCSFIYQGLTGSFEDTRHLWILVGLLVSAGLLKTD